MVDRPEEVFQIGVHDPLAPAPYLPPHLAHRVLGRAPSPIADVGIIEYRLKDRLQSIDQRLLAYAVTHRRYAYHPLLATLASYLRDWCLPDRLRLISILS